jgi:hypothetical protein
MLYRLRVKTFISHNSNLTPNIYVLLQENAQQQEHKQLGKNV